MGSIACFATPCLPVSMTCPSSPTYGDLRTSVTGLPPPYISLAVRDRSPRLSHNVGPGRDASWALCCSVWASSPHLKPPRKASPNYPSLLTLMTSWLLGPLTKPLPFSTASPLSLRTWASRFPYPSPLCCGPRPSPRLAPSAPGPPPTPFPFSSAQRLFWALLLALIPRAGSGSLLSVFARTPFFQALRHPLLSPQ